MRSFIFTHRSPPIGSLHWSQIGADMARASCARANGLGNRHAILITRPRTSAATVLALRPVRLLHLEPLVAALEHLGARPPDHWAPGAGRRAPDRRCGEDPRA